MIDPKKLTALQKRLRFKPVSSARKEPLVQKNLSLPASEAARMKHLAERDGLSQAALLIKALDLYETFHGKLP